MGLEEKKLRLGSGRKETGGGGGEVVWINVGSIEISLVYLDNASNKIHNILGHLVFEEPHVLFPVNLQIYKTLEEIN